MQLHLPPRLFCALLLALGSTTVRAADIVKSASGTELLNNAAAWTGSVLPGAGDVAKWTNTSAIGTAEAPLKLGGDMTWGGIAYTSPGILYIGGDEQRKTLTIGSSGILVQTAGELVIDANLVTSANQTWKGSAAWTNSSKIHIKGNLSGSGNISFTDNMSVRGTVDGSAAGYSGTLAIGAWNHMTFASGLTGGNISLGIASWGDRSTLTVKNGAGYVYSHNLTINQDVVNQVYANMFSLESGSLTLSGTNSLKGEINTGAGAVLTLQAGAGTVKTTFGGATTSFTGNGTVKLIGAHAITSDSTSKLVVAAGTTLDLSTGSLVYSGHTNMADALMIRGTVKISNYSYAGSLNLLADYAQNRVLDGGTLEIMGNSHASGQGVSITGKGGSFLMSTANQTLTLSGNGNSSSFLFTGEGLLKIGGVGHIILNGNAAQSGLKGAGTIEKIGTGTLTLNAQSNDFTGSVVLKEGSLVIGHNNALGSSSLVDLTYSGGTLDLGSHSLNNVSIKLDGTSAGSILNGSSFMGFLCIGWNEDYDGTYELSSSSSLGAGFKVEADTVFTLAESMNLTHKGNNLLNYLNSEAFLTITGAGLNFSANNYGATNGVIEAGRLLFSDMGDISFLNNISNAVQGQFNRAGAINALSDTLSFENVGNIIFQGNRANGLDMGSGGAIYTFGGGGINGAGTVLLDGNIAAQQGGFLYSDGGFSFENTGLITIRGNQATAGAGGAISISYDGLTFDTIEGLEVSSNTAGMAGGAFSVNGDVAVNNVSGDIRFSNNEAKDGSGGAIMSDGGSISFSGTENITVSGNSATNSGGAFSAYNDIVLEDTGSVLFENNSAYSGGALAAYNISIGSLKDGSEVRFEGNTAKGAGGAIYFENELKLLADGGNIIFTGNTSGTNGDLTRNALHFANADITAYLDAHDGKTITFEDGWSSAADSLVYISLNGADEDSTGTILMSGANAQAGIRMNTTLSRGTFEVTGGANYGYYTSDWASDDESLHTLFTADGGSILVGGQSSINAHTITLNAGSVTFQDGGLMRALTMNLGDVLIHGGTGGSADAPYNPLNADTINLTGDATLTHSGVMVINAILSGDEGSLKKTGTGHLILDADNTFTGGLLLEQGTLSLGTNGTLGGEDNIVTILGNATLNLNGKSAANQINVNSGYTGTLQHAEAYDGTVTLHGNNAASGLSTLALDNQAVNVAIADGKFGTVTGWNTAVAGRSISLGAGSTYQGALTLGAGQHLKLTGAVTTTPTNATMQGHLTMSGAIFDFQMSGTPVAWNSLTVNGTLTLSGAIQANIVTIGSTLTDGQSFDLITANSIVTNNNFSFLVNANENVNGRNTTIQISNTSISLTGHTADTLAWNGAGGTWKQESGFAKIGSSIGTANSPWTVVGTLGTDNRFYSNDIVEFKGSGGIIAIAADGVSPKAITVSAGDYTYTGGAIKDVNGSIKTTLDITGGSVTLANANTYTGLTTLTAGTLQINHANALASAAQIHYEGGLLSFGVNYNLTASRLSNAGTLSTLTLASTAGTLSLDKTLSEKHLVKQGAGTIALASTATTASVELQEGILDMSGASANARISLQDGQEATLQGAQNLSAASRTELGTGSILNTSGLVNGTLSIDTTATLKQEADGNFKRMELGNTAALTYTSNGVNTLHLGAQQVLGIAGRDGANAATLNSNLIMGNGGTLSLDGTALSGINPQLMLGGGTLTFNSGAIIDLNGWAPTTGTETYSFALIGGVTGSTGMENITLAQAGQITGPISWRVENNTLFLDIEMLAQLVWNGSQDNNTWAMGSTNWTKQGSTSPGYNNNEYILFNDTAAIKTVTIAEGTYSPISMGVEGAADYTFNGAGGIDMEGHLAKTGQGTLTFSNTGGNHFGTIDLTQGAMIIQDGSSLSGNLNISGNTKLSIIGNQSSANLTNVKGVAGAGIVIDSGASVTLSSLNQGDYLGSVNISSGSLSNNKTLGNKSLSVTATGKTILSGVQSSHLATLQTSTTTGQILWNTSAGNNIGIADAFFTVNGTDAALSFTGNSGVLDLTGTLTLNVDAVNFGTGATSFIIDILNNGSFGSHLSTVNNNGNYGNIRLDGANDVLYYVTGINQTQGSITLTERGRYELTADHKSTPAITVSQSDKLAVVTGADKFRYEQADGTFTAFENVIVNGDLFLSGEADETYIVNNLSGTNKDASLLIGGKGANLELHVEEGLQSSFAGQILGDASGSLITKTGQGTQNVGGINTQGGLSITGGSLISNGGVKSDSLLIDGGDLSTAQIEVTGNVTIGNGTLYLTGTKATVNNFQQGFTLNNGGIIDMGLNGSSILIGADSIMNDGSSITGTGMLAIAADKKLTIGTGAQLGSGIILNLLKNETHSAQIDLGTAHVTVGGIVGNGSVSTAQGGVMTIDAKGETIYNYEGSLGGANTAANPGTAGEIVKTGEGTQILSGSTDANNLYNLTVEEGNLVLNKKKATYGDITVTGPLTRTSVSGTSGTLIVQQNTQGTSLSLENNGHLRIDGGASLTITGNADFASGSTLTINGASNNTAALIAQEFTGMNELGIIISTQGGGGWDALLDFILLKDSDGDIVNNIDVSKIQAEGFDGIHTEIRDGNSIVISGTRTNNNPYADYGLTRNAQAGINILWDANINHALLNQEELSKTSSAEHKNLASLVNSMKILTETGNRGEASRLMAAAAGSTVTSLLSSSKGDLRQQQTWIRNRITQMGVNPNYVHEDMPYFNAWVQGNGGYNKLDASGDEAGYDLNTWGGTAGFDVNVSESLTLGAAFTANYGKLTSHAADYARGHNDAYYANLFARLQHKAWSHSLILTGGWNDIKLDRTVSSALTNYSTKGTTNGSSFSAMYEGTYDIALNENKTSIFQPLVNINYTTMKVDNYSETGAGSAGLDVKGMKANYGTVSLGGRLMGIVGENIFGRGALGELRIQALQDFGDTDSKAQVSFLGNGAQQTVRGREIGTTGVQFGAGLSIPINQQSAIYVDANADLRSKATSINGNIGYRYNF